MSRVHQLKIGVSGIRGVVGEFLTPNLACAFAQAFGTYVGRGRVVLGRDTRASGEMLEHAVTCGLLAAGCEVVKVGVAPTPTIQVYVEETRARGGIAITASHNPAEYNGFKMCVGTRAMFGDDIQTILTLIQKGRRVTGTGSVRTVAVLDQYLDDLVARIGPLARPLRIAFDCANGVGSLVGPRLMQRLGVTVTQCLLCESDGTFPRRSMRPPAATPWMLGSPSTATRTGSASWTRTGRSCGATGCSRSMRVTCWPNPSTATRRSSSTSSRLRRSGTPSPRPAASR